jgi:hypothetical protein
MTEEAPERSADDPPEKAPSDASVSSEEKPVEQGLATIHELFSFGAGRKKRFCIFFGVLAAIIAGCVFPSMAFYFARSFEKLGGQTSDTSFLDNITGLSYAFMVLG